MIAAGVFGPAPCQAQRASGGSSGTVAATGATASFAIADFPDLATGATSLDTPAIANRPDHDEYLVVWSGFAGATDRDIYAQKVQGNGGAPMTLVTVCAAEGPQELPAVAYSTAAGGYWVAWQDIRSGLHSEVYARLLSTDGQTIGDEIVVSEGDHPAIDVRVACGGNRCIFVWLEDEGGSSAILVRGYDPFGNPVSAPVRASPAGFYVWAPDVVLDTSTGHVLVTWAEWREATATDLVARRFDADLLVAGALTDVYSGPANQDYMRIAYSSPANRFLAVWEDYGSGVGAEVRGRLLSGAGLPLAPPIPIYAGIDDDGSPAVAADDTASSFLVVFGSGRSPLMRPGHYPFLRACRVGSNGAVTQSVELRSDANTRWSPAVAHRAGSSEFLAVWVDGVLDSDIMARRLAGDGQPTGGAFMVRASRKGQQWPAAAFNPEHEEYLVVWQDFRSGIDNDVYARRVSAAGSPIGPALAVATVGRLAFTPTVAHNPAADEYLVVWVELGPQEWGFGIYGQRLDGSGTLVGQPVLVSRDSDTGSEGGPAIAVNTVTGEYLVAWYASRGDQWNICTQRLAANASLAGSLVWLTGPGTQGDPRVVYNPLVNEYLVSWYDGSTATVLGRRVTAAGQPAGGELLLLESVADTALHDVACDEVGGGYLVVGTDREGGMVARLLGSDGAVAGEIPALPVFGESGWWPQAAYLPRWREYVVVWERWNGATSWDIHGRHLSVSGAPLGTCFVVSDALEMQDVAALAVNPENGEALAVWEDFRAGNWDIYGALVSPPPRSSVRRRLSPSSP